MYLEYTNLFDGHADCNRLAGGESFAGRTDAEAVPVR